MVLPRSFTGENPTLASQRPFAGKDASFAALAADGWDSWSWWNGVA